MKKSWDEVRNKVINSLGQNDNPKNLSNAKSLLYICELLERLDLNPSYAEKANISNLVEIIV